MGNMSEHQLEIPYGDYVEPLSYNDYVERYGGGYAEYTIHGLAYLLQQRRASLDARTIAHWEADLVGTRYEIKRSDDG
jgi:hypothetical protein